MSNIWTKLSIEYANQRSYLDDLFYIYPTIPDGIRHVDKQIWNQVEDSYNSKDNIGLLRSVLQLDLFPIKDSYVAYLRRDPDAVLRNPRTVSRLCGRLYEMGLDRIYEKSTEPKETNRQIGPMFRNWLGKKSLGLPLLNLNHFLYTSDDAILDGSDAVLADFAHTHLNYTRNKGLDLVARIKNTYIIGEAKFLTDFGGHQNAQFSDAISTLETPNVDAIVIAIMDGVLYIPGSNKMHQYLLSSYANYNIMSALVLRNFIFSL